MLLGEAQQATPEAHVLRAGCHGDVLEQEMPFGRLHHEQTHELIAVLSDPRLACRGYFRSALVRRRSGLVAPGWDAADSRRCRTHLRRARR
jgi:hypothetical protein